MMEPGDREGAWLIQNKDGAYVAKDGTTLDPEKAAAFPLRSDAAHVIEQFGTRRRWKPAPNQKLLDNPNVVQCPLCLEYVPPYDVTCPNCYQERDIHPCDDCTCSSCDGCIWSEENE